MSRYGSDDGADCSINGTEANRPQVSDRFRNLLGGPRVQVCKWDAGELKNWLTVIEKVWGKTRNSGARFQGREGSRKNSGKNPTHTHTWNRGVGRVEEQPENWEKKEEASIKAGVL